MGYPFTLSAYALALSHRERGINDRHAAEAASAAYRARIEAQDEAARRRPMCSDAECGEIARALGIL